MNQQVADAWSVLPNYLAQHVILCACALVLAIGIGLTLAVACARSPRLRWPILTIASALQTIPGLALMALFYPILLALSAATTRALGVGVPALGFLPALLALTLYALLPILRNGVAGLTGADPDILEAAKGVGMTPRQQLLRVEAPLAAPVVMAGVRTAAVWTIGAATLATSVGQTCLGNYIFSGLQTENWISVLFGCAASATLALTVDALLGLIERAVAARKPRRIIFATAILLAGAGAAFASMFSGSGAAGYVIGAKNFSEQYILANLMADRLRSDGASTRLSEDLGSAIAFRAVASNDIDLYVDYAGTLWTNVLHRSDAPPRAQLLTELGHDLSDRYGVRLLGALGFENAYALTMRSDRAEALHIRTLEDLARMSPQLTLGADLEFLQRPEWKAVRDAYGLSFKTMRSYNPTFMYNALASGDADVITAFSSDGRIAAQHLTVLSDPRHALPSYDAVVLLSPRRANDQRLIAALTPLLGAINVCLMRETNETVDRQTDKVSPQAAARTLDTVLASPKSNAKVDCPKDN